MLRAHDLGHSPAHANTHGVVLHESEYRGRGGIDVQVGNDKSGTICDDLGYGGGVFEADDGKLRRQCRLEAHEWKDLAPAAEKEDVEAAQVGKGIRLLRLEADLVLEPQSEGVIVEEA